MHKFIILTQGKVAIVDSKNYDRINYNNWRAIIKDNTYYAVRTERDSEGKKKLIRMHNEIMGVTTEDSIFVDHKNRYGFDNREENLRICTHGQNQHNRSKFKRNSTGFIGVKKCKNGNYSAQIRRSLEGKSKLYQLGTYKTNEEAARAYDRIALEDRGEFAVLNFPRETDSYLPLPPMPDTITSKVAYKRPKNLSSLNNSGYLGVGFHKATAKWRVRVTDLITSKLVYVGYYTDKELAARAYDIAALEIQGKDTITNFPKSNYVINAEGKASFIESTDTTTED